MERRNEGFTLVETAIAISVALIVLTMTISVVFSLHSGSIKIMSKREASENTRVAMSRVLKDLSSAQSLLRCSVWKSSELQTEYETYIRRIENGGDDPSTQIIESGMPTFTGNSADCLEYYETGHVLLRVLPNSVCWFQDLTPSSDQIDYSQPFKTACLLRGGSGRDAQYDSQGNDVGYGGYLIAQMPCSPGNSYAQDPDRVYYFECEYSNADMHYFVPNETVYGDWTFTNGSYREVLNLRLSDKTTEYERHNLFTYTTTNGSVPSFVSGVAGVNTGDILYVNVRMDVRYLTNRIAQDGTEEEGTYRFSQTVLLEGAETYNDEGAYSDKFTG